MKIAHLCNRMGNLADGIINVVVDLATWQARNGHDVIVYSLGGDFEPLLHEQGVRTVRIDFTRRHPAQLAGTVRTLRGRLREFRPDVVHSHTMTPAVLAVAAAPRSALRVTTVHNEFQRGSRLMGLSDVVVCVSHGVKAKMDSSPLCRGKTRVVHNGVIGSPRRPGVGASVPPPLRQPAVVAVGSVGVRKGADVLLAAFGEIAGEVPDAELYFVGNVDEPELLRGFEAEDWYPRVHFEGMHPDPSGYLRAATVLVMASRRDPHPLVVLEGRQAGVAILGSAVDGIPEILDFGRSGLLFESENVGDLARKLRLLLTSTEARSRFAAAAGLGLSEHTVARMGLEYLEIYNGPRVRSGRAREAR